MAHVVISTDEAEDFERWAEVPNKAGEPREMNLTLANVARWAAQHFPGLIWGTTPDGTCVRVARVVDGKAVLVDLLPEQAKVKFVLEQAVETLNSHHPGDNGLSPNLGTLSDVWWPRALAKMLPTGARFGVSGQTIILRAGASVGERQAAFSLHQLDQLGIAHVRQRFLEAGIEYNPGLLFGDPVAEVALDASVVIANADAVFGSE